MAQDSAQDLAQAHILVGAGAEPAAPVIRHIRPADLVDALRAGWNDFAAMPTHAVFLCAIYPLVGIGIAGLTLGFAGEQFRCFFPLRPPVSRCSGRSPRSASTSSAGAAKRASIHRRAMRSTCCTRRRSAPSWRSACCS